MKIFLLTLFLFTGITGLHAQIPFLSSSEGRTAVAKVLKDYPYHFAHIKGEEILRDVQTTEYACTVNISDADPSVISVHGEEKDNVCSWKTVLLQTDDFNKAKTKFHQYFNDVKQTKCIVRNSEIKLKGDYEEPEENKNFTSIIFSLHPAIEALNNVVVDLSMEYTTAGWQLSLSVYEHKDYGVDEKSN